ncbi:universal stress protein [Sinomonas sp.]|jgi:nucleotide-binding universal stress UspA family protein|uniref:universal stress protein n=1 Tax=Sinomonas sp. TaxID=1914986 RepID=UPI002FE22D6A
MRVTEDFVAVVGVDGSPQSREALAWAAEEAALRGGRVVAVTAWEFPLLVTGLETVAMDREAFAHAAERVLDLAVGAVSGGDVRIDTVVGHGSPAKVILEAAEGADLVVVGSRGLGGFAGLLLGSVSAHLVHHCPCTVVVIRHPVTP